MSENTLLISKNNCAWLDIFGKFALFASVTLVLFVSLTLHETPNFSAIFSPNSDNSQSVYIWKFVWITSGATLSLWIISVLSNLITQKAGNKFLLWAMSISFAVVISLITTTICSAVSNNIAKDAAFNATETTMNIIHSLTPDGSTSIDPKVVQFAVFMTVQQHVIQSNYDQATLADFNDWKSSLSN